MPRLRAKRNEPARPAEITEAICICGFSSGLILAPVQKGQVLPRDDARVTAHPEFFRALGPSMEEVLSNGK
jgi:hypothetical protein